MVAEKSGEIRALTRGLDVLARIEGQPGCTLHGLHLATRLPKPTLKRILATLESAGYVRRGFDDGLYYRSARKMAPAPGRGDALAEIAGPILDELCQRVVWPSDLAIYDDGAMCIVETSRRRTPFLVNRVTIGYRVNMLPTAIGRAWLAFCPADERAAIIRRLASSTDPRDRPARRHQEVARILDETRRQGYGVRAPGYATRPDGVAEKMAAIAAPVFAARRLVACVNIVWIASAVDAASFAAEHFGALKAAADRIGRRAAPILSRLRDDA